MKKFEEMTEGERLQVLYGDRCLAQQGEGDERLLCLKSTGHTTSSDPKKAAHYDPDADVYFDFPGMLKVTVEIPGVPDYYYHVSLPEGWATMTENERMNARAVQEERTTEMINVYCEYDPHA